MSMSLVTVSVAQIAYLSGNIGRDLSFDLSLGEASTSFNRRLPAGQTVNLSQPMGQFTVGAGPVPLKGDGVSVGVLEVVA